MLPPSWKGEIEKAVDEKMHAATELQKTENDKNAADIAAEIKALNDTQQAEDDKRNRQEKIKRAIEIATVILLFGTAFFTTGLGSPSALSAKGGTPLIQPPGTTVRRS
jgi:hypothetical protein